MSQIIMISLLIIANAYVGHCNIEALVSQSPIESKGIRKLGKQGNLIEVKETPFEPTQSPTKEEDSYPHSSNEISLDHHHHHNETTLASKNHHRSIDKSIAGGGVIIGGLAVTFLVAVFCYIRATRRVQNHKILSIPNSPTTTSSSVTSSPTTV